MIRLVSLIFIVFNFTQTEAQDLASYLKRNAVRIESAETLSDSIYNLLSPFQLIMIGEMHGTNEPAEFTIGLAELFAKKGDSIQVGLEIRPYLMKEFLSSSTDSALYRSEFFTSPPFLDGRESFAWAKIISRLKNNPRVQLFFFDIDQSQLNEMNRDSIMYLNIKRQIQNHPKHRVITLSGNAHNRIITEEKKTAGYLINDGELKLSLKFCSLVHTYLKGACRVNSGDGLKLKQLEHTPGITDTTLSFDKYLILSSGKTGYPYSGNFYTRNVTASEMTPGLVNISKIKSDLTGILERDQKTRTSGDSSQYMQYIDSCNLVYVENLIKLVGWPGKSLVGGKGNNTVFLVIQHADLDVQEKYLPLLLQSVNEGESRECDLAYLIDRVYMRQGKKQVYGSQVVPHKVSGAMEFYPIEDEANLNSRREKAGLQPIEEYAKYFGIEYKSPK